MKLTAIKTVRLDGPPKNGKPTQFTFAPGEEFDTTTEIGLRLIARGKAEEPRVKSKPPAKAATAKK